MHTRTVQKRARPVSSIEVADAPGLPPKKIAGSKRSFMNGARCVKYSKRKDQDLIPDEKHVGHKFSRYIDVLQRC